MAYFPFFIDLECKLCLVVGGGHIAFRKVETLLEFGAKIKLVAPIISDEVGVLSEDIILFNREFEEEDLKGVFLVVAATDDETLNSRISHLCKKQNILVNVVDVKEECSFIFPAYVKKGDITVGVTTGGNSPVISQHIKKKIKEVIPDYFETLVKTLGEYRPIIKEEIDSVQLRTFIYKELAYMGIQEKGDITEEMVRKAIKMGRERYHEKHN